MNLETLIFFLILLGLILWFSFWIMKKVHQATEDDDVYEVRGLLRFVAWALRVVVLLIALVIADRFNFIDIPNPFDGAKIENEIPRSPTEPPESGAPPEIEVKDGRPNMDDIRAEHQDQLDEFEEDSPPKSSDPESDPQ